MSTYSPVSIICLVACAKRDSSRSVGGIEKKPGKMLMKVTSRSTRSARACDCVAKSATAVRLYAASLRSLLVVTAIVPDVLAKDQPDNREFRRAGKGHNGRLCKDRFPIATVP